MGAAASSAGSHSSRGHWWPSGPCLGPGPELDAAVGVRGRRGGQHDVGESLRQGRGGARPAWGPRPALQGSGPSVLQPQSLAPGRAWAAGRQGEAALLGSGHKGQQGRPGGWGRLHPSSRGWCPQMRRPFRGAPSGLPPEGVTGNALGRSEDSGQRPCGSCRMKVGFAEPIMSKAERKGKQKITLRKCTLWRSQRRFLLASPISEYKLRSIHATFLSWVVLK